MRTDRRALTLLVVLVLTVVVSPLFRSYASLGVRLLEVGITGQAITLRGSNLITVGDENNPATLSSWSLLDRPQIQPTGRDEQVGLILVNLARYSSQPLSSAADVEQRVQELQQYCQEHPDDIKATAHYLRLGIQGPSTNPVAKEYVPLAQKLLATAIASAKAEPDNWYWRDRCANFYSQLGKRDKAVEVISAKPYPTRYDDYTKDEEDCRTAIYRKAFPAIPDSLLVPEWAAIIFPHFLSSTMYLEQVRANPSDLSFRLALIELGRCMTQSKDSWICKIIGLRLVKTGLWASVTNDKPDQKVRNAAQVEAIHSKFIAELGSSEWKWANDKANMNMGFAFPSEPNTTVVRFGHLGPFFLVSGMLGIVGSLIAYGLSRRRLKSPLQQWWGYALLWIVLALSISTMRDWKYLQAYSLGCAPLAFLLAVLGLWLGIRTLRSDDKGKLWKSLAVLVMTFIGFLAPQLQAVSMIVLATILIQNWNLPLRPWIAVAVITLLTYHEALHLAFTTNGLLSLALIVIDGAAILSLTKYQLDPDESSLGSMFIPIAFLILGIFLTAQYDRGMINVRNEFRRWETERSSIFQ